MKKSLFTERSPLLKDSYVTIGSEVEYLDHNYEIRTATINKVWAIEEGGKGTGDWNARSFGAKNISGGKSTDCITRIIKW